MKRLHGVIKHPVTPGETFVLIHPAGDLVTPIVRRYTILGMSGLVLYRSPIYTDGWEIAHGSGIPFSATLNKKYTKAMALHAAVAHIKHCRYLHGSSAVLTRLSMERRAVEAFSEDAVQRRYAVVAMNWLKENRRDR